MSIEILLRDNFGWTVEVDGQAYGPIGRDQNSVLHDAKRRSDAFVREGKFGAVYSMKGAGPIKTLLWEFGSRERAPLT